MKFKIYLRMVLIAFSSLTLVACNNDDNRNETTGNDNSTGGSVSVAIWDSTQEPGLRQIMNEFTDETGIRVDLSVITWDEYWTLLQAGAQGGSMPDVFWMHSAEFQRYADNGMLLDLSDKINESDSISLDRYYSDIVELYSYDGRQYAIPKDIDTIALWYNKAMFDEAGIDYPDETWTWDTLVEVAAALTNDNQYGFGWDVSNDQDGYYNLIYSNGGYVINEDRTLSGWDSPQTIEAMGYVERLTPLMPSLEMLSENGVDVLFESGQLAMATFGSWMISSFGNNDYLLENANVAVLPMSVDENRVSMYNGLGWAAAADSGNTENAWLLIEFLGSEEMQIMQAELGVTMSAIEGLSEMWVSSVPEFNLQAYLDMTENMVIRPFSRNANVWTRVAQTELQRVWSGQPVGEVLQDIAQQMNQLLEEERQ